jgi:hypothetical protein
VYSLSVTAKPNAHEPPDAFLPYGLIDGELAWRQHDGGHKDRSNMNHSIAWANALLKHAPPAANQTTPE